MKFDIRARVSLVVGLLLFLLFVTSAGSYLLTNRIEDGVAHVARVDELRWGAAAEMQLRLPETARTVLAYAVDREASDIARIRKAQAEFDRSAAAFTGQAVTDEERVLGQQVVDSFRQLKELGAEIVAVADREHAELEAVRATIRAMDEAVAAKTRRPADRSDAAATAGIEALLGMSANIAASGAALESGLVSRIGPGIRDKARTAAAAFGRYAARYRETAISSEEQAWLAKLSGDFAVATRASSGVMDVNERKRQLLERFDIERDRIEGLLASQIAPLIGAARERGSRGLALSISTAHLFLLMMVGFGMLVGGGAALLLAKRIVRPILDVAAGAEAIGSGKLDHRVAIESDDEIGQLADSINRMAEDRQQTE